MYENHNVQALHIYDMKSLNIMIFIHIMEVNNIYECNLIHDILNPSKYAKYINIHYSPILLICKNTREGKASFYNFRIFLDSVYSSTIVTRIVITKLNPKEDAVVP